MPRRLVLSVLLLLYALLPAPPARAATAGADLVARIDQLLQKTYPAGEPGAAVLVERDGQVLLRQGYGMANLEISVPIRPEMVFRIGSITKQFTAVAVLKLAEQGKLGLDDEITKYLPDYPTHGQRITIENLLTHTSGIKSYTSLAEWRKRIREDLSVAQIVDLFKDQPADFAPGEKWLYDNSGYFLLGAIVEKVTGKPYADWMAETLFTPLGLTHTTYGADAPIVPGRVAGYEGEPGYYQNASYISMTHPYAAGALVSTVDDLDRWARALAAGTLVRKDLLDRMTTSYHLKNGRPTGYGYGLGLWSYAGHRVVEHNGGINGFTTALLTMPDDHLVVVVLSNNADHQPSPDDVSLRIAAIIIGRALEDRKAVPVAPPILDRYVGVYRTDETITRVVRREGDHLVTQRLPGGERTAALAASPTDFFYADFADTVHFTTDASGKVAGLVIEHRNGGTETAPRTTEPLPAEKQAVAVAPALLDGLVGTYALTPQFEIAITREGDHLALQATGQGRLDLFAQSPEEFFLQEVDAAISFHRGPDGKATELVLHQGGRDQTGKRVR